MISSNSSSTSLNVETDHHHSHPHHPHHPHGKKPLKEGAVQLTSLSTLLSHHRYFFLYHETLIISKQKGACSYKLKEKLKLEKVWIASSNTADSFLIGWPFTNYLVHFRNTEEKDEWFEMLSCCVQQCLRPLFTTISMDINVRGRKQTIRRRVENGKKSGEIVVDTAGDLGLPHTSYQLTLSVGDNSNRSLQGPENVYVAIMSEIERQGTRLSESQKQSLDTCPIANCRLILSTIKSASGGPSAKQIVNSIKKKVLTRTDSRSIFGKDLSGPTPPQPIMTIVDHLRMEGFDAEGIFRKSPKQSTFKELKSELDKGVVPDFHKYNTHVLASILKEYLRSIPGKILLSGNYELWMREVADESDEEKKLGCCRALLSHLPTSHSILLANVLKLLNKIANSPTSKMNSSGLSVCLAPSFLESPDPMEGGKKIPPLVEFLISNAAQVVPGFSTDNVFAIMSPIIDHNSNLICSPAPSSSHSDDGGSSQKTPIIEELNEADDATSQSSLAESDLPDEPRGQNSAHLETISEISEPPTIDERLVFSSSDEDEDDDDDDDDFRSSARTSSYSRTSFVSETLKSSGDDVEKASLSKDAPRSPCLKRIHFRGTEAQHRTKEGTIKLDFEAMKFHHHQRPSTRKSSLEEVARKNSAEFAVSHHSREPSDAPTPTPPKNCQNGRKESREEATQTTNDRFPEFKSSMLAETYQKSTSSSSIPSDPAPRDYTSKPIVQVAPFTSEPSLKTINDRLNALRKTSQLPDVPAEPTYRIRPDSQVRSATNSPIMTRSTMGEDSYAKKKPELQRSSSQRGLSSGGSEHGHSNNNNNNNNYNNNNNIYSKQIYSSRASSVKATRRFDRGIDGCVGMDPLEINWSVSHLKTLFQDSKAPAIDTVYNG